jgi:hypothetical protein
LLDITDKRRIVFSAVSGAKPDQASRRLRIFSNASNRNALNIIAIIGNPKLRFARPQVV